MVKPKHIEGMKNLLIVALFFSTMLLLYFIWEDPMIESFRIIETKGGNEHAEIPLTRDIIKPERVIVHFGTGVYTTLNYDDMEAWNQCILTISQLTQEETLTVEEITRQQYDKIMEFRSICFEFLYDIPFNPFCSQYNIPQTQNFDQIDSFSLIGYSSGSPESLFIQDRKNDKYYRLVSEGSSSLLEELITQTEAGGFISYYPIGTIVGTDSTPILPLSIQAGMKKIPYKPEFDIKENESIKEFAKAFFGESFDFVRRIEESKGTIIYMYGYGQKMLTINGDGSVEYKEKVNPSISQPDYFGSLNSALQFVAFHGSWQPLEGEELIPYLRISQPIEREKKKGYRFIFGMKLKGEDIFYENDEAIVVEILSGQVIYYRRNMVQIDPKILADYEQVEEKETFSPINMLAQNYQYIYSVLLGEEYQFQNLEDESLFEMVSDMIQQVEIGYIKPRSGKENGSELVPAWIVKLDDNFIFFDLYDAHPLGYNNSGIS